MKLKLTKTKTENRAANFILWYLLWDKILTL